MDEQENTSQQSLLDVDLDTIVAEGKKQNKKNKKKIVIATIVALCMLAGGIAVSIVREEAARAEAYNKAVLLSESGQYTKAIEAFTALGNYKDSAEQLDKNVEKNEEVQCKAAMATSLKKAYTQLKTLPDSYSFKKEMLAICEPYIQYCGNFECIESRGTFELTSGFRFDDGQVYWSVSMPEGDRMGIYEKSKYDTHYFFTDANRDDLKVEEMTVIDFAHGCQGKAEFLDGKIYIGIKDYSSGYTFWDREYRKST